MKQTWTATIIKTEDEVWGDDPPNHFYVPIRSTATIGSSHWLFRSKEKHYMSFNDYTNMVRRHGKKYVNDRYFFKSRRDAIRCLKQAFPGVHRAGVDNFKFEADIL